MLSRSSYGCAVLLALVTGACDTVPLTAPSGSTVTITAASAFVPTGGTTEVTAFVAEEGGTAVQNGTTVRFTTNLGRMEPIETQTKNGYAVATFIAGDVSGVANVVATSGSTGTGASSSGNGDTATTTTGSNSVQITVGGAAASVVVVTASPSTIPAGGGTVTIIASVLDANGNRLRNIPVSFSADKGSLSATVATTDANGEARVQLTTTQETVVSARAGAATDAATVKITVDANVKIELVTQTATNPVQLRVTPAQGVTATGVIVDFGDGESTDLGPIRSETVIAHRFAVAGTYPIRVTQTNQNGSTNTALLVVVVPAPAP